MRIPKENSNLMLLLLHKYQHTIQASNWFSHLSLLSPSFSSFSMLKEWVSGLINLLFKSKVVVCLCFFAMYGTSGNGVLIRALKRGLYASFTCIFALGGAIVGTIVGAMQGQTTETGFLHGAGIGAVAGAITALQLLESAADGESLSKLAILTSLMNGKVFIGWVSPAILKAYQWQISTLETTYREISDVYDVNGVRGLSKDSIQRLPGFTVDAKRLVQICQECCSICLQDFLEGDSARRLPNCGHCFHLKYIDEWLTRNGSCPVFRESFCKDMAHLYL